MTNICMLSTGHSPRDDRLYHKEAISLAKIYPEIVLVMPGEEADFNEHKGIKYVPLKKANSIIARLMLIPIALVTVLKIRPEVCHFHDYELLLILPFLRLLSKCKIIYDVYEAHPEMVLQSNNIPDILKPLLAKLVNLNERILSRFAHSIITADDNIAKSFINSCKNVTVIFNYPILSLFVPDSDKLSHLKSLYQNRTPIIYQGGMSEQRGIFQMIKAMEVIKNRKPDIILLLVGQINDKLLKNVKEQIKTRDLEKYIELIGEVPHEEVVNYISVSKIGLVPLLPTEKFKKNIPQKQFEYMACGIPVLGADLPPIASYIIKADCGKVYNSTSYEELAQGIIYMIEDEAEWKRMSSAGKKAIQKLWNWNQMEEKLLHVYESILER
jgi:glycosyltransferase involved in cell wall biosynthesis